MKEKFQLTHFSGIVKCVDFESRRQRNRKTIKLNFLN